MNKALFFYCIAVFLFFSQSCYKEEIIFDALPDDQLELPLILALDHKDCFFDKATNSLRYSIAQDSISNFTPHVRFQDYASISIDGISLANNASNSLGKVKIGEEYVVELVTKGICKYFTLRFTNLPIVRIVTPNVIIDEPKKLARLTINSPTDASYPITSFVGIEIRGGSSQSNPKKSYGFAFLNNMSLGNKVSKSLFDWDKNEDWILDAMYNDPSRLRNKVSFEIWQAMNPLKHHGIQSKFVELYLNNDYQGIYCLNEKINAEKLGLNHPEAVLYKTTAWGDGTTTFEQLNSNMPHHSNSWDGWEQKYPIPKNRIHWAPLHQLRDFIINENDHNFSTQINTFIDLDLFIDYYIFLNLTSAFDNTGKNIIWVRQNATAPFFITPWDLDGSLGQFWDGSPTNTTTILSNHLFDRLLQTNSNNFKQRLKNRWFLLRGNVFSSSHLNSIYDNNFAEIGTSDILFWENLKWNSHIDIAQQQYYIINWTQDRLLFLDDYFTNL